MLWTLVKLMSTGSGDQVGAGMTGSGVSSTVSASPSGKTQARTAPTTSSTTATSRSVSPASTGQWMVYTFCFLRERFFFVLMLSLYAYIFAE